MQAAPDGYTVILVSGSYGANAALHKLTYDSVNDITPIILIGETGLIATIFPKSPIRTVSDLIAFGRANPGKLLFGSAGSGGLGHLTQELFKLQTKIDITHVPYKGSGPVMTALLSGEVHTSFSSVVPSIPHIKAGRLRAIGVTPPRRIRALPDVPTINETVPGFEVVHWYGIWGPKGIPARDRRAPEQGIRDSALDQRHETMVRVRRHGARAAVPRSSFTTASRLTSKSGNAWPRKRTSRSRFDARRALSRWRAGSASNRPRRRCPSPLCRTWRSRIESTPPIPRAW